MNLLTNSRAKLARLCAAKHDYRYLKGYVSTSETEELNFGTAIHLALEAWWRATGDTNRLDAALGELTADKFADEYARARALVMISGYHHRWNGEPFIALAVEPTFRAPLVNPDTARTSRVFQIAGKLDAIVRNTRDGSTWILEHKTSSEDVTPGSVYHRRLRMDSQVSLYFDGASALGFRDVSGCIYDVLSKPAQRPYKATPQDARKYTKAGKLYTTQHAEDESVEGYLNRCLESVLKAPEKFFARLEVPRLEAELHQARRDLWVLAQRMHFDETKNAHSRNVDACVAYGRVCEFFDACSGVASLDDARLFRRIENPHQELNLTTQ